MTMLEIFGYVIPLILSFICSFKEIIIPDYNRMSVIEILFSVIFPFIPIVNLIIGYLFFIYQFVKFLEWKPFAK